MLTISILALPGCLASAVYGVAELLLLANQLNGSALFRSQLLSPDGQAVKAYGGATITPEASLSAATADILVVPPLLESFEEVMRWPGLIENIRTHQRSGNQIATICAGSFLLAETGLLDGRDATTHWNLAELFHQRYPKVTLKIERLLIDGGEYICAGGVTAWMDLSLYLIARHGGRELSRKCAKMMLMDPHREHQTPYSLGGFRKDHADAAIRTVQEWLEEHYGQHILVKDMADRALLGERTFIRRFRAATGGTPASYLQQLRITAAQTLLETTDLSAESIAEAVGYTDYSTFRKTFKRGMGCTPSLYRQRFGS